MKNKDLDDLKTNIGFKTAFRATLGFYVAQTFVVIIAVCVLIFCAYLFYSLG